MPKDSGSGVFRFGKDKKKNGKKKSGGKNGGKKGGKGSKK